ncbi:hypothetical protein ASC89_02580 [Devosia sp. Root413D1]|uniref:VOC family protein n=1 Tax=unclassified Devosia TaxID=196773 RepID=UPI0006F65873|nr:VOC family protein [Devosia sp. Root413D1]KQW85971.1 hypothetical protein ASC89_02580 [Devosia sp. Root413D1]
MSGTLKEIVFDCTRAAPLARFWTEVIQGYAVRPYDDEEIARLAALGLTPETDPVVMVDGPGPTLCFHEIERGRVQGRIHLDVQVADRPAERTRLIGLGAAVLREADGYTVMADPEGNHFCLVD